MAGRTFDSPFLQRPAVHRRLHLEPRDRRFHGRRAQHLPVAPPSQKTPRNLALDRSSSALDHRQRFTFEVLYDMPFFKHSSWFLKNIVGNWEVAPIYTYQSGTWVNVQSGVDANLNGDTAGDRTFINPGGQANVGTGKTPLTNSAGDTVAYLANNPNARYIEAGKGTLPNGGRNTAQLPPIDDIDMTIAKSLNVTEGKKLQFSARFLNMFNHPQYRWQHQRCGAYRVSSTAVRDQFLRPQTGIFMQPSQAFSSNPRTIQLALKFIF